MAAPAPAPAAPALRRRALRLEYVTIAWNAVEGTLAIVAGILARSVALTAFGLDSSVEVFASSVAAWQLRGASDRRERLALRLIGACFLVVALYVGFEAVRRLLGHRRAGTSPAGVVITSAAAVIMSGLGLSKRRIGRALGSAVLQAEARFSLVDAALSVTVLIGLVLNLAFGWWWADPGAALVLALYSLREAAEGLQGRPPEGRPSGG
jgi:divalent metal cation (Fe/Co/Zn/Cd) transporter